MHRILLCDPLDPSGLEIFREAGAQLRQLGDDEREKLPEIVEDFDAIVVRSRTKVTAELLRRGRKLKVVGRAGIGVDNVDIAAATDLGILVVNAPTANLVSATEHTFALLLALARNVPAADRSLRAGEWDRKRFLGRELDGKTLGVVGLGRIGQAVAHRARAFGMTIVAYDPYLDPSAAKRLDIEMDTLEAVLGRADVVTLHMPLTDETRDLISAARIAQMKQGSILVNCARGGIVDDKALLEALESGHLAGAALDVFEVEPPEDRSLIDHPKVVGTPHIGAQTREAQERVATQTARMVLAALDGSLSVTAVNLPFRAAGPGGESYLRLSEQLGRLASSLLGGSLKKLQVDLWGVDEELHTPVSIAAVRGALSPFLGEAVNFVNAEKLAEGRGIAVVQVTHRQAGEYPHLVGVTVTGEGGTVEFAGTVFGESDLRVVRYDKYRLEFRPEGRLLLLSNRDVPGVVGRLGSLLGEAGINIADIHLARGSAEGEGDVDAVAVLRLDQRPEETVLDGLRNLPEVSQAQLVELG
ncbi:MAG: phosphoglycerate dehydrogenase [bacterium]|nr:phosphoglycerate dehydrogenase [bacterium]